MTSGCGDTLSLTDLQTAKKHQLFEAEVITGKQGGVASGADIEEATNQVTGQVQKTLPAVLRDAGFRPASFDFTTGGTLGVNDRDKVVFDPVSMTWYSWAGTLPKVIPPGTNPVGNIDWTPKTDPNLRNDLITSGAPDLVDDSRVKVVQPFSAAIVRSQHDKNTEYVSVLDFGAIGDGVTDDSAAFTAALTASNYVHVPFKPSGYRVSNIIINTGKTLLGEGRVVLKSTSQSILQINSFSTTQAVSVSGFTFDMNGASIGSRAIVLKTSIATVYNVRLYNLSAINCYGFIHDETPLNSTTWVHDLEVRDCSTILAKDTQIYLRQSNGFILFDSVKIDNTQNATNPSWISARFDNIAGLELSRFDVLGAGLGTPTYNQTAIAIRIIGSPGLDASVWLNRVLVDYNAGPGLYIASVYNVVSEGLGVHITFGDGITLNTVTKSRFVNTSIFGPKANPAAPAAAAGLRIDACSDILMSNTFVQDCTGNGVNIVNSSRCSFNNITSTGNNGSGWAESGTSNMNIKSQLLSFSNGISSLVQVGAQSACVSWVPNAGGYVASTIGPATV